MVELAKTTDMVRIGYLKMLLEDAGLHPFVFDSASAYAGVIPARLMSPDDEAELARHLIAQAER